jgi:hypothetical protein
MSFAPDDGSEALVGVRLSCSTRPRVSSHDSVNRGITRRTSVGTPVAGYPSQAETRRLPKKASHNTEEESS